MAIESTEAEVAKLAAHAASGKYHDAFRYREADRPSRSVDDVTTSQLGHMLDSLNDALIFMQRLVDKPKLDVSKDPAYEPLESEKPVPPYLTRIATDPRNASSYFRLDIARPMEVKKKADLAYLSNHLHGLLRLQAHYIGQSFIMPDHIKPLAKAYQEAIDRYTALLDAHKNPKTGKRDYTQIPDDKMTAYAAIFTPAADALFSALKNLKTVEVEVDGKTYSLPNDKAVNDRLEDSFPALILFGASIFSKGVADRNKRPGLLEFEGRFRTILGAESLLTDTAQFLANMAPKNEPPFAFPDFDRDAVKNILPEYKRSLQLALAFCHTADCGYDKLYEDMGLFLTMAGAKSDLGTLQTPQEAALMLHAVDRRFAREDKNPALQKTLREYADAMGNCETLELVQEKFGRDIQFQRTLQRSRELAEENGMTSVVATLQQLHTLIPPVLGKDAHMGSPANPQDRALP